MPLSALYNALRRVITAYPQESVSLEGWKVGKLKVEKLLCSREFFNLHAFKR
jgi:hypothetical protein